MKDVVVEKSKYGASKFKLIVNKQGMEQPKAAGILIKGSEPELNLNGVDGRQLRTGIAKVADIVAKVLDHEAKAVLRQSFVLLASIDEEAHVAASVGVHDKFAKRHVVQSNGLNDVVGDSEN
jgi:hypothetical protein